MPYKAPKSRPTLCAREMRDTLCLKSSVVDFLRQNLLPSYKIVFPELGQGVAHNERSTKAHQDAVPRPRKEKGMIVETSSVQDCSSTLCSMRGIGEHLVYETAGKAWQQAPTSGAMSSHDVSHQLNPPNVLRADQVVIMMPAAFPFISLRALDLGSGRTGACLTPSPHRSEASVRAILKGEAQAGLFRDALRPGLSPHWQKIV
ncbi:hypothetical protein DFH94DRAFT_679692 [Russula ochroleuca]|uniref:Uncharacterized protein n=1 Tax=Russula ochroleuca TaxID=152965 RepID=A0A9P5N3J3_9AGAM|nr:hypothetical protein DFH94DRAFT_679692 [Russula ochroleuca]